MNSVSAYSPLITTHPEKRDLEIMGMLREIQFRASRYGVLPYFEMPFRGTRYMMGTRGKGDSDTGDNNVGFRCVVGPSN